MDSQLILRVLLTLFPTVLFLQSGLDKLFNMKDNLSYIRGVFASSFMNPFSTVMFFIIMVLEVATGVESLAGVTVLLMNGDPEMALRAFYLGAATTLMLFGGQRIAKDYAGAAGIVPYFLVMVAGMYLLSH